MKAMLVPLDGSNPIEIQKDLLLIGRQADCDLRLDHKTISKRHCVLLKTDRNLVLRDLGSTNGCRVNGQRITRTDLLPNDILAIAGLKYRIYLGPDDGEPTPVPASEQDQPRDATEVIPDQLEKPAEGLPRDEGAPPMSTPRDDPQESDISLGDLPMINE